MPDAVGTVLEIRSLSLVSGVSTGVGAPADDVTARGVDPRALMHFAVSKYRSTGEITSVI